MIVHFLDRAKRPLDLAFRSRRRAPLAVRRGHMRENPDTKATHDGLENARAAHRPVIHMDGRWNPLKRQFRFRLGGEGIVEKAQGGLRVLAVDGAVFLIARAGAIIDHGEQHQRRPAAPFLDPKRRFHLLQVGRAHVEVPEFVGTPRLESDGSHRAGDARIIQAGNTQQPIDRCAFQDAGRCTDQAIGRHHAVFLKQLDGARRGDMPPLPVRRSDLQGRDDFGIGFHLRLRGDPGGSVIGAPYGFRAVQLPQRPIQGPDRDAVGIGGTSNNLGTAWITGRKQRQSASKIDKSLSGRPLSPLSHGRPRIPLFWESHPSCRYDDRGLQQMGYSA